MSAPSADTELLKRANRLLMEEGDPVGAAAIYERLAARYPQEPRLLVSLGVSLIRSGRMADARRHLTRALGPFPAPETWLNLARTHEYEGAAEEALDILAKGLAQHPGNQMLLAARGDALLLAGRAQEAWETLEPLLAEGSHPAVPVAIARVAPHVGKARFAIDMLRAAIEAGGLPGDYLAQAHFQLAHLLDREGEYEAAFRAAERANHLRPLRFDPERFVSEVSRLIETWTPERVARLARATGDTSLPVFIVGMPRSGTSVTEQIIAAHPSAHAGGELPTIPTLLAELARLTAGPMERDEAGTRLVQDLSRRLLSAMRSLAPEAARVTDKLPANALHLGLIWQLAPGGRAIHCRRDPLDTCLSCYFQQFSPVHAYAGDLEHLAAFHAGCERMMEHWRSILDYRVLEVRYEELAGGVEAWSRRIIDFLTLEWTEACARPHESRRVVATASSQQVRRPVYTSSIGRAARYGRLLDPLREALERYAARLA